MSGVSESSANAGFGDERHLGGDVVVERVSVVDVVQVYGSTGFRGAECFDGVVKPSVVVVIFDNFVLWDITVEEVSEDRFVCDDGSFVLREDSRNFVGVKVLGECDEKRFLVAFNIKRVYRRGARCDRRESKVMEVQSSLSSRSEFLLGECSCHFSGLFDLVIINRVRRARSCV